MAITIVSFENFKEETKQNLLSELNCEYIYIDRNDRTRIENVNPDFLICRDFDVIPEIMDLCTSLKMIFILSVGVNRLPFEYLRNRDISVYHVTGEICANEISQYVMNGILMDCYGSGHLFRNQFSKTWERGYAISSSMNKTVLIFGYGNIGARIASVCHANKMSVSATSLEFIDDDNLDKWMPLEEAINSAGQYDYVVNALPLTSETYHMYDSKFFSNMSNTCFINIGRGDHVVEEDIYQALSSKTLRYAVLDVFSAEPLPVDSPLWDLENIVITPHISGRVVDFADKAVDFFIRDCKAFLAGETTRGLINLEQEF